MDGCAVHTARVWTVPALSAEIPHPSTGSPRPSPTGLTRRCATCLNEIKNSQSRVAVISREVDPLSR
ncbi:hypothetical protein X963_5675 [Burkholderia pseudomallei MSHR7498]|nr:hypothetical protein X963_5675 [Burkholderia pseudomallei MSHR7498]